MQFHQKQSEGKPWKWSIFDFYLLPGTLHRFADRSARFMDAYRKGLTGSQAQWANRRYHGHRVLPTVILDDLRKHNII